MDSGYIHVYTGEGKGKTTCSLGLALRAVGAGKRVYIGQFIKKGDYSEIIAIREYLPMIKIEQYGKNIKTGYSKAVSALTAGEYDLVIFDEINTAVYKGFLDEQSALALIDARPGNTELVLTGRYATPGIIEKADLVTEMLPVRHYFKKGVRARKGIEK